MNKLKELRLKSGLTIKDLSEKIGLASCYLSQLETGKRPLNNKTLKAFCDFYKVKPNELLGYDKMVEVDESDNYFNENDLKMLRAIKSLPQDDYVLLMDFIDYLIFRHKKNIEAYYDKKRNEN